MKEISYKEIKKLVSETLEEKEKNKKDIKFLKIIACFSVLCWAIYILTYNALFGFATLIFLIGFFGIGILRSLEWIYKDIIERLEKK